VTTQGHSATSLPIAKRRRGAGQYLSPIARTALAELGTALRAGLQLRRAWLAVGTVCLVDWVYAGSIGLTLTHYTVLRAVMIVLVCTTIALRVAFPAPRFAAVTEMVALWVAFAYSINFFSYLAATPALPLRDDFLAQLDRMLGFDWLAVFGFVQAHQLVAHVLSVCYFSLIPETFALGILFAWTRRQDRVRELFWLAFLSSLIACVLSGCIPVLGAFQHYGLPAKAPYLHDLDALRSGVGLRFSIPDMQGIVTFPSYHATLALVMVYVVRGMKFVGPAVLLWNLLMVIATVPIGGHYLVDVIGGVGVLLLSIAAYRWAPGFSRTSGDVRYSVGARGATAR